MPKTYPWLPLSEIAKYEPEMKRLGVSKVARSRGGFLYYYKQARGNPDYMSEFWKRKRTGFIARHLAQFKIDRGYRRWLSLIAWAYKPSLPPKLPKRQVRSAGKSKHRFGATDAVSAGFDAATGLWG